MQTVGGSKFSLLRSENLLLMIQWNKTGVLSIERKRSRNERKNIGQIEIERDDICLNFYSLSN